MEHKASFNAQLTTPGFVDTTTGTYTIPPYAEEDCPTCNGKGYIHCTECGEHTKCHRCGGSGKKYIYNGGVYIIHWHNPNYNKLEVSC